MADRIRRLRWFPEDAAQDLHVLPGQVTRNLTPGLWVFFATTPPQQVAPFLTANPGSTLAFRPLFNGVQNGAKFESVGLSRSISVTTDTGVVEVSAAAPTPLLPSRNNFLIEIELQTPGRLFREVIRVQIHQAARQAWLTPAVLTVPAGRPAVPGEGFRFTVRAQFDDNTVGDVTVNHGVTWSPAAQVSPDGFLQVAPGDAPGTEFSITAQLSAEFGGITTPPAKLRVASGGPPPRATAIVGGRSTGTPEQAPNVLLVSDGFTAAQQPIFEQFTDLIVHRLRTSRLTRPYDLLATSMNFWRVFIPSPTSGPSCREEVYTRIVNGKLVATPLPPALRPPAAEAWKVEHLIYAAGYPLLSQGAVTPNALRADWTAGLPASFAALLNNPNILSDDVIAEWKTLATRTFIDEVDGYPGVGLGSPPSAAVRGNALLEIHPGRGGESELTNFLSVLAADDGATLPGGLPIGHLWLLPPNPAFRFDNTTLIVILSSYPGGRPLNVHRTIAMGTDPQREIYLVTPIAGRNSFTLDPLILPGLAAEAIAVAAHEIAHSFGIGDEYQEFSEPDPQYRDTDLDGFGNLQYETAVRTGRTGPLRSELIKWNWHRIQKATTVEGPITAEGGGVRFRVPVPLLDGFLFDQGEHVLLRVRKQGEPLGQSPVVALDAIHEAEVVGPLQGSAVILKAAAGSALSFAQLAPFTPGSLIYAPVPAPASAKTALNPYAEMVAKNIRDYIDTNDKPLTPLPCAFNRDNIVRPLIPGVTIKSGFCGHSIPLIVGLYSGGNRYSCGVFHPTGSCIMAPGKTPESKEFCPVCRYILVDFINPALHGLIDKDYERIYPQP